MFTGHARQKPQPQPDGTVKPNRAMRREQSELHGKKRFVVRLNPLWVIDIACTKRRPWAVKADRRAANARARTARRANR